MAVKVARESFTKEEIIDILKRNVTLYKGERDFVEYIVNLAMFLIEQQQPGGDGQGSIQQEYGSLDADSLSSLTPMPVTGFLPMGQERPQQQGGPGYQTPSPIAGYRGHEGYASAGSAAGQYDPGQASGQYQQLPPQSPIPGVSPRPAGIPMGTPVAGIPASPLHGVSGQTPVPPGYHPGQQQQGGYIPNQHAPQIPALPPSQYSAPQPGSYQQLPAQAQMDQPRTPMSAGPRYSASPSRFDVEASPLNTPTSDTSARYPAAMQTPLPQSSQRPSPGPSPNAPLPPQPPRPGQPGPSLDPMNSKTKVYKVFRSYSSTSGSTADTVYCPICGTEASGARKCPNCGHLI